jgi:hypothetical protein
MLFVSLLVCAVFALKAGVSLFHRYELVRGRRRWLTNRPMPSLYFPSCPVSAASTLVGVVGGTLLWAADAPRWIILLAVFGWLSVSAIAHTAAFMAWARHSTQRPATDTRSFSLRYWFPVDGWNAVESAVMATMTFLCVLIGALVLLAK